MQLDPVLLLAALGALTTLAGAKPDPDDGELMERIARGDQDAFLRLYQRHAPVVLGMLVRMVRDRGAAEDLLQEIFLSLWKQAARYDRAAASVLPWLLVIGRNRALDRLRSAAHRHQTRTAALDDVFDLADARAALSPEPWRAVDASRARAALGSLGEQERRCLELAYFEGLTQSEIAAQLGQPLGTVKTWARNGLAKLRQALAGREKAGGGRAEPSSE